MEVLPTPIALRPRSVGSSRPVSNVSTTFTIDEDLLNQVRSLVLSRNGHLNSSSPVAPSAGASGPTGSHPPMPGSGGILGSENAGNDVKSLTPRTVSVEAGGQSTGRLAPQPADLSLMQFSGLSDRQQYRISSSAGSSAFPLSPFYMVARDAHAEDDASLRFSERDTNAGRRQPGSSEASLSPATALTQYQGPEKRALPEPSSSTYSQTPLTALPPRWSRAPNMGRSLTQGTWLSKASSEYSAHSQSKSTDQQRISQSLTNAILDVERLLSEALYVAQQAAATNDVIELQAGSDSIELRSNGVALPSEKSGSKRSEHWLEKNLRLIRHLTLPDMVGIVPPSRRSSLPSPATGGSSRRRSQTTSAARKTSFAGPAVPEATEIETQRHEPVANDAGPVPKRSRAYSDSELDGDLADLYDDDDEESVEGDVGHQGATRHAGGGFDVPSAHQGRAISNGSLDPASLPDLPHFRRGGRRIDWAPTTSGLAGDGVSAAEDNAARLSPKTRPSRPSIFIFRGRKRSSGLRRSFFKELLDLSPPRPRASASTPSLFVSTHGGHAETPSAQTHQAGQGPSPQAIEMVNEPSGTGGRPVMQTVNSFQSVGSMGTGRKRISLRDRRHVSFRGTRGFSLRRLYGRQSIARDWSKVRKRFVAAVTCINTAFVGLIIGIYAGEVPAIQYKIVDLHHYVMLGNVFLFVGLAIPTLCFWTLPLLHGRKPYVLAALSLLIPLQLPQGLAVGTPRSPYVATYRVALLLARALSGVVLGFANMNFQATLLDLFGASLQSNKPHEEFVLDDDPRRHGGGMGVWLGIWSWCFFGSLGVGFLIGAAIISGLNPAWGFWLVILLAALVLLLNILVPEVRRSPFRKSMTEVRSGTDVSRRLARGEVMMHLYATGPLWWGEEVRAGLVLCWRMIQQPGFAVLCFYVGWLYAQMVMVVMLLGALLSKYYRFKPQYVGLCVAAVPIGALLAVPFQKASLFSRAREAPPRTDSMTFETQLRWTSHLVRRAIFMLLLPFAGLAYCLASGGPRTHFLVPTFFAGTIGFLSNLAVAECNGLVMETYDTSDLQPGMVGRRRASSVAAGASKSERARANYSCYPRVCAAFALTQTLAFALAAAATAVGGAVERRLGAQTATGVVAAVLLALTLALVAVLWRWKVVQVIPVARAGSTATGSPTAAAAEPGWRPVVIGTPSGRTRRMNILELGRLSRWSEIRRLNQLME